MNNTTNTVFTSDLSVVRLCARGGTEPGSRIVSSISERGHNETRLYILSPWGRFRKDQDYLEKINFFFYSIQLWRKKEHDIPNSTRLSSLERPGRGAQPPGRERPRSGCGMMGPARSPTPGRGA